MADDFHGTMEWQMFRESMKLVFPDRPIVDIPDNDPIFHTVFDLDDRYQIPGAEHLAVGYKNDGMGAHWRGIYDDKGRIMVAISYNSDIGDSWEWADDPQLSREILRAGDPDRRELRRLRHDALGGHFAGSNGRGGWLSSLQQKSSGITTSATPARIRKLSTNAAIMAWRSSP